MEVVLAIGILATTALAILSVFVAGVQMSAQSGRVTMATEVGREFIETVKSRGYSLMAPGNYDGRVPDPADGATGFPPAPYPRVRVDNRDFDLVVHCSQPAPLVMEVEVEVHTTGALAPVRLKTWLHQ